MSTMTNILPHDVVVDILSRLPVKSLLQFRCVSKPWKIFFSDPSFIKRHLKHSINNYEHVMLTSSLYYVSPMFNDDACFYTITANNSNESSLADEAVGIDFPFKTYGYRAEILGSCNGLLLINPYEDIYCIWNPSTKEFKKLPDTPNKMSTRSIEYGFGYDKITDDYKVVRIVIFNDHSSEVKIYTLGSDSWRRIEDIPETLSLTYQGPLAGKLVNGVLHWVASTYEENSYVILSLNIEDEKFGEIQPPDFTDTKFQMTFEVVGGCLCIICNFYRVRSEIWAMKEYGVKESWTKLFTIAFAQPSDIPWCYPNVRPIKFTNNGEVLLVKNCSSLVLYDPKHGSTKTLQIRGLKDWFDTYTYVESLISLNSGTFVGQEQAAWKKTLMNRRHKNW